MMCATSIHQLLQIAKSSDGVFDMILFFFHYISNTRYYEYKKHTT